MVFLPDDGFSPSEVNAIVEFVENGGTAIVLEDYGFAGTIAEAFGVRYSGYQLFDTTYATELNYNYIWMCVQSTPCSMNGSQIDVEPLEGQFVTPRSGLVPHASLTTRRWCLGHAPAGGGLG